MRFGVREICNVVFRAKATQYLGSKKFYKNEPVLYFDTLKTSSLEGAATTVYATGGRGNAQLVAWEGERTMTFTMEDALISPESFAILSGAGLLDASKDEPIYVHTTSTIEVKEPNKIELPEIPCWNRQYKPGEELYHANADIFVMTMTNGQIDSEPCIPYSVDDDQKTLTCYTHAGKLDIGDIVFVDYYVKKTGGAKSIEITPDKFGGYYYVEAETLFRDEQSGVDMPAEFVIPKAKVQSNFTFSMASSGDPSTFTFTMDAFPDYTKFKQTKKVLAIINVITEAVDDAEDKRPVCYPGTEVDAANKSVTVTYNNDGTEKNMKVTVTGTVNTADEDYYNSNVRETEQNLFLAKDIEGKNVTEIVLTPGAEVIDGTHTYTVTQVNPALYYVWPETFPASEKTSENIKGDELIAEGFALLLSDKPDVVKLTIQDDETKAVVQTIQIHNKVSFTKKGE